MEGVFFQVVLFLFLCIKTNKCQTNNIVCPAFKTVCQQYEIRLAYIKDERSVLDEFTCSCDTMCKFFNDCCEDALANPANLADGFSELSLDLVSCVSFPEVSKVDFLYYVDRCPPTWPDSIIKDACEIIISNFDNFLLRVPVTGHNTGLMYKNMYCAMCHGSTYLYWVPEVRCEHDNVILTSNTTLSDVYLETGCFLKFKKPAPDMDYRHCLTPLVILDKCSANYSDKEIKEKCERSKATELLFDMVNLTITYRNPSCAKCISDSNAMCKMRSPIYDPYEFFPLIIRVDLNNGSGTVTRGNKYERRTTDLGIPDCRNDQVLDPFNMTCVTINCMMGMTFKNGICQQFKNTTDQDCSRIQLYPTEYTILDNGDLFEISSGLRYTASLYYMKNSSAFVCSNVSHTQISSSVEHIVLRFSPTEVYITVAGLLFSLVALFLTILTYSTLKLLNNTTDKSILSLACSLFVADLLMLTGSNAEHIFDVCKGVAICMHYFFLAAFFWMNVMAVDALKTVSKLVKNNVTEQGSKMFLVYSIFSWIGPALIVVTSIVVDSLLVDSTFKPNYGMGLCWLTNKNALIVFFAGPLFFIISVNTILFVIIATKMHQMRGSGRDINVKDKTIVFTCLRLSVVIGLTWVIGFIANLIPHPVFWYSFILLNTLQGLFIFISFVATRRVWRVVRDRFGFVDGEEQSGAAAVTSSPSKTASYKACEVVRKDDDVSSSKTTAT